MDQIEPAILCLSRWWQPFLMSDEFDYLVVAGKNNGCAERSEGEKERNTYCLR
jgi:hypothetical protein